MNRRRFLAATVIAGAAATPLASVASRTSHEVGPLPVPDDGVIRTAFAIGDGVNVIDLAGPWDAFQDASIARAAATFDLLTVAASRDPVSASGGLTITPTATYDDARRDRPPRRPHRDDAPRLLRRVPGAVPEDPARQGRRFVEHDHVATAGGLTSGIDSLCVSSSATSAPAPPPRRRVTWNTRAGRERRNLTRPGHDRRGGPRDDVPGLLAGGRRTPVLRLRPVTTPAGISREPGRKAAGAAAPCRTRRSVA
jgi:hypothetical protein